MYFEIKFSDINVLTELKPSSLGYYSFLFQFGKIFIRPIQKKKKISKILNRVGQAIKYETFKIRNEFDTVPSLRIYTNKYNEPCTFIYLSMQS